MFYFNKEVVLNNHKSLFLEKLLELFSLTVFTSSVSELWQSFQLVYF